jgi:prolipoprotein diacylglyceryltransferase
MYPTISDLLYDLFGINIPLPIQSFGFMLAFSFLCAAYTLSLELKRKEKLGLLRTVEVKHLAGKPPGIWDIAGSFLLGFLIGYKVIFAALHYGEFVNDTQGILLSMKGSFPGGLAVGALMAWLKYRDLKKQQLPKPEWKTEILHPYQLVGNFTMVAAVAGLLGAKIFHNLENISDFAEDPIDALLSFSGLTMYGGLIVGGAAVLIYASKNGVPPLHFADACAPGLMLAYGTGRVGCHIAGDGDWGIVNKLAKPEWLNAFPDWLWSYSYPHNVLGEGIPIPGCEGRHCMMLPEPVFPTPLYEAIMCIGLFFVLWQLRRYITVPGILFCVYLIMNGVERFFIEKIRVNTQYHIFGHGITQAEIISVVLIILGITGIFFFRRLEASRKQVS